MHSLASPLLMRLLLFTFVAAHTKAASPSYDPASEIPPVCPNPFYTCCWPPSRLDPEHAKRSTRDANLTSDNIPSYVFDSQRTLEVGGPTAILASVYEAVTGSATGKAKRFTDRAIACSFVAVLIHVPKVSVLPPQSNILQTYG